MKDMQTPSYVKSTESAPTQLQNKTYTIHLKLNTQWSFSWKLVKIVTEGKNSKCEFFNAIIWEWKLDISCVHKYKT